MKNKTIVYIVVGLVFALLLTGFIIQTIKVRNLNKIDVVGIMDSRCFWIDYADKQENLLIAEGNLLTFYGNDGPVVEEKWATLSDELALCEEMFK